VEHFAVSFRLVTVPAEMLGEGDDIGHGLAEVNEKIPDFDRIRPKPGQKAGPGWVAHPLLTIGPGEFDARIRQAIDRRRFNKGISVTTEFRPEIIDGDEQDVGFVRG
jgi:hypothetical protein